MRVEEIEIMLDTSKKVSKEILQNRLTKGQALIIKNGIETFHEYDSVQNMINKEGIRNFFEKEDNITETKGLGASPGKVIGTARVLDSANKIPEFKEGEILVTFMTTMQFTPLFSKAKAIICDEGGISSHAAIVSREFKIPCIVGTKNAMKFIKTGDLIEVDADKGIVKKI